ncbi:hypothetical protein H257_09721 [Aphanomyces astaci]|uniref:Uncharacterized protein n=1 Tax=Aphanomyces astaci TaxID=112090 RepID=W4GAY3_APHAT|nr:hypothetical protein H257_09721 [Aphanomyces astaci]ETV76219.1 hypothetical protein H257_09721 [Aphanomyces astaci]|eukprot:XP_009834344.1 hypothetical protein H257_09721 [Aphanomyces astaci]
MLRHKRRRLLSSDGGSRSIESGEEPLDTLHDHAVNDDAVMDDTLAAIHVLLSRYHAEFASVGLPSLVLWHQIYCLVDNRTAVDQSIQRMRTNGLILTLRISLPGGAVRRSARHRHHVNVRLHCVYAAIHQTTPCHAYLCQSASSTHKVACRRRHSLYGRRPSALSIAEPAATAYLNAGPRPHVPHPPTFVAKSERVYVCSHLVQRGFLVATTNLEVKQFYFSLPRLGMIITGVARARSALTSLLKRQPYKQMLEVDMRKKKLTCSCLSMDFHILDMAGAALVGRVPSSQTFVLTLNIMDDDGTTR